MMMTCFTVLKVTTYSKEGMETTNFLVTLEMTFYTLMRIQMSAIPTEIQRKLTYCLEAQAMINCMVAMEVMSYSEVQAMTYSTEVMAIIQLPLPLYNCTEKMEMMKFGPDCMEIAKFGVALVMI